MIGAQHFVDDDRMLFREAMSLSTKYAVNVAGWGREHSGHRVTKNGVEVTSYRKRSILRHIELLVELYLHMKSGKFDVLHCYDMDSLLVAVLFSRLAPRRPFIVYDMHEHYPSLIAWTYFSLPRTLSLAFQSLLDFVERVLASNCDGFVTVNDALKTRLERFGKPIVIVRNVHSLAWFDRARVLNLLNDAVDPVVVSVGTHDRAKGLDLVIQAKASLDKRGVRSCFVVTYPLAKLRRELPHYVKFVGEGLRLTGPVDYRDVPSLLKMSQIALLILKPSSYNYRIAEPSKLFAYMVAGLPVVASDLPAIRDIVTKENFGLLVDNNSEGIADSILQLLMDKEMRILMGKNARKAAEREYNWELEAQKLFELYRSFEAASEKE